MLIFLVWATFAPGGFRGAPVVAVLMGGITIAALRLRSLHADGYWEPTSEPPQSARIALLIAVCLIIQTALFAAVLFLPMHRAFSFGVASDAAWTSAILIFLATKIVALPKRVARPRTGELVAVALLSTVAFVGVALLFVAFQSGPRVEQSWLEFLGAIPRVVFAAAIEEVVFRLFLLTALIQACKSSKHALVLSSIAFALAHIPGAFATPIMMNDQYAITYLLDLYPGLFVWQLGLGFALGALWIRTGSILLVVALHTVFNLGSVWVTGAEWVIRPIS